MIKFIVNREKDDDKYQVHNLGCSNRPLSNFFYVEAQNLDSAIKKAEQLTGNKYYPCKVCK
ncbi:MAG: hypothetical protein ACRC8M_07365 [Cetobacterium sp.]|uniref:hypothetical protein n=1 Tax=Cetobacterium sp. TaxID=2071632 RepID=UPI003F39FECD